MALVARGRGPGHPLAAIALCNLAALYQKQGRYADAEPLYQSALTALHAAVGPHHPFVAVALGRLGRLHDIRGRRPEAEQLFRQALAIWDPLPPEEAASGEGAMSHVDALNDLGR